MKTYRNDKFGFEIDVPEAWSLASGRLPLVPAALSALELGWVPGVEVQFVGAGESLNVSIETMAPEPPPDVTERLFRLAAQDMGYAHCEYGRITVGGRQHTWARYVLAGQAWSKKYMLVLGGKGYAITGACQGQAFFAQREPVWDAVAASFRLLAPLDRAAGQRQDAARSDAALGRLRETLDMRLERRGRNLNYGRACEALEEGRYADARLWLERCLSEFPDDADTQVFLLQQLVSVAESLGDRRGALRYQREIRRLRLFGGT